MRNPIALLACSFVMMAANANDPAAGSHAPATAAARAEAVKIITESVKPKLVALLASRPGAPSSRAREEEAEVDLSARIAARLAVMRANQAARVVHAAKARRAAVQHAAAMTPATTMAVHGTHWSYEGEAGPANWSKINPEWAKCGSGARQSPIDLRDSMKVDLEQISFDYKPSSFNVVDNGHTIQVTLGSGNTITIQNRMYELVQFHFHRPSEERINGKGYEMVVHLVHKDGAGKLAVLAILLERGKAQSLIQTVWNNLPLEKNEVVAPSIVIDPGELLPQRRDYFTFMGSLTTPPCSEGVLWLVMKEPVQASPAQMALFSRLYPLNARPIQASSGRVIKESN